MSEIAKTYDSAEELLADWDGSVNKQYSGPNDARVLYYLHFGPTPDYQAESGYKFVVIPSMGGLNRHVKVPEDLQEYINNKAEDVMALFHLNSKHFLKLELPVGFILNIYRHNSKVYTFEFVEEEGNV